MRSASISDTRPQSYCARCAAHARARPEEPAIIFVARGGEKRTVSWALLEERMAKAARRLAESGANASSLIVIAIPSGIEHCIAALAAWKLGACVLPLNPDMPPPERDAMLALAATWRPIIVVADWQVDGVPCVSGAEIASIDKVATINLDDRIPHPGRAIGSGGSTGRPKIIIDPKPWAHIPGHWGPFTEFGLRAEQRQLICGRMHHGVGFALSHIGLFEGHTIIIPEQFIAAQIADLIEEYRVQFMGMLPIMLQRLAKLPDFGRRDFSSIEGMYHAGGVCPDWVKLAWMEKVGDERLWEGYSSSELKGHALIRGDEWRIRRGSAGRAYKSEFRILDSDGCTVPNGTVGDIFMRNIVDPEVPAGGTWPQEPTFEYLGSAPPPTTDDGFVCVGDLGWLDDDGYLYLADRRVDMIKSGGINVYPAEVEATLSEHHGVADVVVVGVPDSEWGLRVHAIVEPAARAHPLEAEDLDTFCRTRLSAYKSPKSYEFVEALPRESSGKINRSALREARRSGWSESMVAVRTIAPGSVDASRK